MSGCWTGTGHYQPGREKIAPRASSGLSGVCLGLVGAAIVLGAVIWGIASTLHVVFGPSVGFCPPAARVGAIDWARVGDYPDVRIQNGPAPYVDIGFRVPGAGAARSTGRGAFPGQ